MRFPRIAKTALLVAGFCALGSDQANGAGIIFTRVVTREIGDPIYNYQFDMYLDDGWKLVGRPGDPIGNDFVTIYDITGLAGVQMVQIGWLSSIQNSGINPFETPPPPPVPPGGITDNPDIPNVTFSFFRTDVTPTVLPGDPRLFLGTFGVQTFNIPVEDRQFSFHYAWRATRLDPNNPNDPGTPEVGTGTVGAVPEPASLALTAAGLGLAGVVALARRKRS